MQTFKVLILAAMFIAPSSQAADDARRKPETTQSPVEWDVKKRKADDRVTATIEKGKTIIDVHSKSGIGSATLSLTKGTWPKTILIRLHLKGLEGLTLGIGKTSIDRKNRVTKKKGYYEVELPQRVLGTTAKKLTVSWIDFYR